MREPLFRYPDPSEPFEIQTPRVPIFYGHKRQRNLSFFIWLGFLVLLLATLGILGNVLTNGLLLSARALSVFPFQWLPMALMAVPAAILFSRGGFDWSYGAVFALAGMIAALPIPGSSALAIATALAIGLLNGTLVGTLRYPGLIITLVTFFLARGLVLSVFQETSICEAFSEGLWGSIGWAVLILLIVASSLWIQFPIFGRKQGVSEKAVPCSRFKQACVLGFPYVLSSLMAGLGGIFMVARLRSAVPNISSNFSFEALLVILLGGSCFASGYSNILGAFLGALFLMGLKYVMNLMGIDIGIQYFIVAILLVVFLVVNHLYHVIFGYVCRKRAAGKTA